MRFQLFTTLVLLVTGIMTFIAFQRRELWERWMLKPQLILRAKQYDRMLLSGFIHLDWWHFTLNAYSFYSFGSLIEARFGWATLLAVYFAAILGGSTLALILHRNEDYSALGASGGVCGVIFASIFLLPYGAVRHMFIFPIPNYIFAILFLIGSYYGHRKSIGHVAHDAHLGGAIIGLLLTTALYPQYIAAAPLMFAVVLVLSVTILALLVFDPFHTFASGKDAYDVGLGGDRAKRYAANRLRNEKLAEIDRLLEKVSRNGINSLSNKERQRLETLSKEVHGAKRED